MNGFQGTKADAVQVLDISAKTFSWGDHGLTSVWIDLRGGWLYLTYMTNPVDPNLKNTCTDYGQIDGRPMAAINGCVGWGAFSRWPLDADGNIAGAEQVLMDGMQQVTADGETTYLMCVQYATHSVTSIAQDPNTGDLYVAAGDGAAFTNTDYGQMGTNPCMDRQAYLGAFRVQDPVRVNGKILHVDGQTMQWRIFSTGHRNPWRIHWDVFNNRLLESETGWYTAEEINIIEDGKNYGWPCFEGMGISPHYDDDNFHGNAACQNLASSDSWTRPAFYYTHPQPPPPNNVMSITAVAAVGNLVLYGDYTQKTADKLVDFQGDTLVGRGISPVELRVLPDGHSIGYVDYDLGAISTLDFNAPVPTPSTSPAPPTTTIVPQQDTWTAGSAGQLQYQAKTTIEGREGMMFTWTVVLETCASPGQSCTVTPLVHDQAGPTLAFNIPSTAGTVKVDLTAKTYGGLAVAAPSVRQPSVGAPSCACNDSTAPSSSSGTGLSTTALSGIIVAACIVGVATLMVALYAAGVPQRLGMCNRMPVQHVNGGGRSAPKPGPAAGRVGTAANSEAPVGRAKPAAGQAVDTTATNEAAADGKPAASTSSDAAQGKPGPTAGRDKSGGAASDTMDAITAGPPRTTATATEPDLASASEAKQSEASLASKANPETAGQATAAATIAERRGTSNPASLGTPTTAAAPRTGAPTPKTQATPVGARRV